MSHVPVALYVLLLSRSSGSLSASPAWFLSFSSALEASLKLPSHVTINIRQQGTLHASLAYGNIANSIGTVILSTVIRGTADFPN